jgi:H+/Cl- antiporter ClcA
MQIGSIKTWLNLHTYFGLIGFFLVLFHAGLPFQFRYADLNAGTVSLYLMIIAVISGFIGRYLYRRMDEKGKKIFKSWRDVHVPLVGVLIFFIVIHIVRP